MTLSDRSDSIRNAVDVLSQIRFIYPWTASPENPADKCRLLPAQGRRNMVDRSGIVTEIRR